MGTNGFREDELITKQVNGHVKVFPIIAGRLRIVHENNDQLSIQTEIIRMDSDFAVVKAAVESRKGKFNGTGTASAQRDAKLADSLVELAETRAIARALRFGGIGCEYTSAEEISHVSSAEPGEQSPRKESKTVFTEAQSCTAAEKPKPSNNGNGRATGAQVRALFALTMRLFFVFRE